MIGQIKSIPVTEVTTGMQVYVHGKVFTITEDTWDGKYFQPILGYEISIDEMKALVVEWNEGETNKYGYVEPEKVKTIRAPLKYSFWLASAEKGFVDSNKEVSFIINRVTTDFRQDGLAKTAQIGSEAEIIGVKREPFIVAEEPASGYSKHLTEQIKFIATRFAHECRLKGVVSNHETIELFDKWFPEFSKKVK